MVFVDAVGNRMTVDVEATQPVASPPAPPRDATPGTAAAALQQITPATAAGATGTVTGTTALAAPAPDNGAIDFGGESYQDIDHADPETQKRDRSRFYQVPDGQGGMQTLSAETLGVGTPPPLPPVDVSVPFASTVLPCPAGEPVLEHLLALEAPKAESTLRFPVYDPTLKTRQRFAGYRISVPSGTRSTGLQLVVDNKKGAPDIVLVLVDPDLRPWMVVNNKATETIPETPFHYAMVSLNVPMGADVPAGSSLVVMEGAWARRVLAAECRPQVRVGTAVAGQVVIRFFPGSTSKP